MPIDKDIAATAVAVVERLSPDPEGKRPWSLYHNTILKGHFPTAEAARQHSLTLLQDSHDERRKQ